MPVAALDEVGRRGRVLMLPDPQHRPTKIAQLPALPGVPLDIRLELVLPPLAVVAGRGSVLGAPVPEAAIDEHRQSSPREAHVRSAGQRQVRPEAQATAEQLPPQGHLRSGVPAGHAGHLRGHLRTGGTRAGCRPRPGAGKLRRVAHWIHLHAASEAQIPDSMVQCVARIEHGQHRLRGTETPTGGLLRPKLRAELLSVLDGLVTGVSPGGEFGSAELDAVHPTDKIAVSVQAGRASNNNQALIAVLAAAADPGTEWLVLVVPDRYGSFTPYLKVVTQLDALASADGIDLDLRAIAVLGY